MAKKAWRQDRQDKNDPKVSTDQLLDCIAWVMDSYGVAFTDLEPNESWRQRYFDLFKALLMIPPAVVLLCDMPLTVYGVGSFRVHTSKTGLKRFRARYSPLVSKVINEFGDVIGDSERDFWKIFSNLSRVVNKKDASVLEVNG